MTAAPRMLMAVAAGYGVSAAAAGIGSLIARAAFPPLAGGPPTTPYLAISIAIGFLGSLAGGYLASRLAPDNRRLITLAALVLVFLGVAVATARLAADPGTKLGFLPAVTMLGVIGVWAGAMAERAVHSNAPQRRS